MPLPNFLLFGGVRCGSSSLFRYLRQHPDIFLPFPKEPSYLCWTGTETHQPGPNAVTDFDSYVALFDEATEKAIGEASVIYLYLADFTARRIREVLGNPKLIAILRNPADRAFSQYRMATREGAEDLPTFTEALAVEDERVREGQRPIVHYRRQSVYSDKLQRFIDEFGRERIKVCLFDDLTTNPAPVLQELFGFLDVDPGFEANTAKAYNVTSAARDNALNPFKLLRRKKRVGRPRQPRPDEGERLARLERAEKTLAPSLRTELLEYYESDVRATSELIGQDLSAWLTT